VLPAEVRQRAQARREAARLLVKESRQLRDKADVLFREAEAVVEERRRALWAALKTSRLREQSGQRAGRRRPWRGSGAGIALGWRSW